MSSTSYKRSPLTSQQSPHTHIDLRENKHVVMFLLLKSWQDYVQTLVFRFDGFRKSWAERKCVACTFTCRRSGPGYHLCARPTVCVWQPHVARSVTKLWLGDRLWNGIKVALCHISTPSCGPSLPVIHLEAHAPQYLQSKEDWIIHYIFPPPSQSKNMKNKRQERAFANPCSIHFTLFPFDSLFLTE